MATRARACGIHRRWSLELVVSTAAVSSYLRLWHPRMVALAVFMAARARNTHRCWSIELTAMNIKFEQNGGEWHDRCDLGLGLF